MARSLCNKGDPEKDVLQCFAYEKPTLYSAPNANSKLGPDGTLDFLTQERALLNKVSKLL